MSPEKLTPGSIIPLRGSAAAWNSGVKVRKKNSLFFEKKLGRCFMLILRNAIDKHYRVVLGNN
jgi:hypothetical protein